MDMITKIELEDALANYVKVEKRIVEVAMIVGDIEGVWELPSRNASAHIKDGRGWRMTGWHIDLKEPREGMEHLKEVSCRVDFEISFTRAPDSDNPKIGLKEDREGVFDDEYEREPTVTRRVEFPYEYLLTTGWEERARAKHAEREARMVTVYREREERNIAALEERLAEARARLEKYTR